MSNTTNGANACVDRLNSAGLAAKKFPDSKVGEIVATCPLYNCQQLWDQVNKETKDIVDTSDPLQRNTKITSAYAKLNQENPEKMQWAGLAAIVSRQAGCAMQVADNANIVAKITGYPQDAHDALVDGNKAIFSDIYPPLRFYQINGLEKLKQCPSTDAKGDKRYSQQILPALELIDTGDPEFVRLGSDKIAEYEQKDIIQDKVYSVEKYKKALKSNEDYEKHWYGRLGGAQKAEIPLSADCGAKPTIPLDGSILKAEVRVKYYNTLMDGFLKKTPSELTGIMNKASTPWP